MLSLSKIGLRAAPTSNMLRPGLIRGIKTIPQPPGFVVGTVNDAYVAPKPKKSEGSLHWTSERAVAIALVPFTMAPFLTGANTFIDSTISGLLVYHCYTGFQSCILDYIPKRVYGIYHNLAMYLLTFGTGVAAYGVYEMEKRDDGVTGIISKLWKA